MAIFADFIDERLSRIGYQVETRWSTGKYPEGHWHSGYELFVLHSGVVEISLEGESRLLWPGSAALFPARLVHMTRPVSGRYLCTPLHFSLDLILARTRSDLLTRISAATSSVLIAELASDVAARFLWAAGELRRLQYQDSSPATVEHLVGLVVSDIVYQSPRTGDQPRRSVVSEVIHHMLTNLQSEVSIAELARRFYVSESHLRHLFMSNTGYSPHRFWRKLKIQRACELLRADSSVDSVAAAVGFTTRHGFERAFYKEMGVSPAQYRKVIKLG